MTIGTEESEASWSELLAQLNERGLSGVQLAIADAHSGLAKAVRQGYRVGILDLPSFYADMGNRAEDHKSTTTDIVKLLKKLNEEKNITLVVVTHDEHLTNHMHRVIHLKDGAIIKTTGKPKYGGE